LSLGGALGAREQSDALGVRLAGTSSGWGEAPAPLLEKERHDWIIDSAWDVVLSPLGESFTAKRVAA